MKPISRPRLIGLILALSILCVTLRANAQNERSKLDFANGLFTRGFYEEAADEYRAFLKDFPQDNEVPTALYRLAESVYAAGDYEAALKSLNGFFAKKTATDPDIERRALIRKGEILYRLKKMDEAISILTPFTAKNVNATSKSSALYYLGKVYYETNRPQEAAKAFGRLSTEIPDSPLAVFARYNLAFIHLALGKLEDAAIEFSGVAEAGDASDELKCECLFKAGDTYEKIGWFDSAVQSYARILADFPDSPYAEKASYGHAWALYHAGKFKEAADATNAFLAKSKEAGRKVGATYLLGNCLQHQKKYDEAIKVYDSIRTQNPKSPFAERAHYMIAWVLNLQSKDAEAKKEITTFLDTYKQSAQRGNAAFLIGSILQKENNHEDAYEEFRLVAEKYKDSEFAADALFKSAECLAKLGRKKESAEIYSRFAETYPENALTQQATLRAADQLFYSTNFADAIKKYEQVLASSPSPDTEKDTLYRMAITFHNMRNFKSSSGTFERLLARFPKGGHVAEANLRIGDYHLREKGDHLKSVGFFDASYKAGMKGPFAGQALKGLALARYEMKDHDGAAETFLKIITTHKNAGLNAETYEWVGQHFFDEKKWDQAANAFSALIAAYPKHGKAARVSLKIAECSEKAGKKQQALQQYQEVAKNYPNSISAAEAKFNTARLFELAKDIEKAIQFYEESANSHVGDFAAQARFHLGELYEVKKEYSVAARSYMRVAILFLHEELSPESLWRAGQCFEKASSSDQARKAYKELVDEYPKSEQAAKAKQRLQVLL